MSTDALPDFVDLHTFVVAARWMHLTRAATELHVTQGAVSQRIKQLELRLGTALFVRTGRELQLTPAGHAVRQKAEVLLAQRDTLFGASPAEAVAAPGIRVIVNTTPSLARGWLLPRFPTFHREHPGIALQISCAASFTLFRDSHAEIAIRLGSGQWPQVDATPLMDEWMFPAMGPAMPPAALPQGGDWSSAHLLEYIGEPWSMWLPQGMRVAAPVLRVNDSLVLMEACQEGLGIALLRHRVAGAAVAAGRLLRLPEAARPAPYTYWLVTPRNDSLSVQARDARARVADWLFRQAADDPVPDQEQQDDAIGVPVGGAIETEPVNQAQLF